MATANEKFTEAMIKRRSYIQLLVRKIQIDMLAGLDSTHREIKGMLHDEIPKLSTGLNTKTASGRFASIGKQYKFIRKPVYEKAELEYTKAMAKFAEDEAKFVESALQRSIPFDVALAQASEVGIKNLTAFAGYDGKTISQWFTNVSVPDYSRIEGTVRTAISQGLNIDQTINQVIGTKYARTGKYTGAVQTSRTATEALVRTVTNGVANGANQEFAKANSDIISHEVYTAVLDGRTSQICASLDGKVFKVGEGAMPPLHPNCRSMRIAVIDGAETVGTRPTVGGKNFREQGKKDYVNRRKAKGDTEKEAQGKWNNLSNSSKNGYVNRARREFGEDVIGTAPANTTYNQFLKKQSVEFQNDVLGVTNAKKYRAGEMTLDKFTDKLGKPLNLTELRAKYPEVYD